jgi:MGT family glycosyltransferase
MGTAARRRTVVFFPEGAFGPTNNCVGIGDELKRRGLRVVFVVEESFAGTLAVRGFEERLIRLQPAPAVPEEPGQFWKDFIRETAPHFRESPRDQLQTLVLPIWEQLTAGAIYVDDQLRAIFAELQPDVIVQDNVVAFPAVVTAGVPWVRLTSCNPLEIGDPGLPPAFSGLPMTEPGEWEPFRADYRRLHAELHHAFDAFCQERGCPPLPDMAFMLDSPYLNLFLYPAEVDYMRSTPLPATFHRLDASVRTTEPPYPLPGALQRPGKLIYVSLGSLGSAEPELMQRLVDMLGATSHRVIISLGPQAGRLRLPDNVHGDAFLPKPSVLPLVDAVITHGGNNTTTESFSFGKPMLVLPLFWDQHDNAQRVDELGFGIRFAPYEFTRADFVAALDDVLADRDRQGRLDAIARRLQASPGRMTAANLIERLASDRSPVLQAAVD